MIEILQLSIYMYLSILWGLFTLGINKRIHPEMSGFKLLVWMIINTLAFPISLNIAVYNLLHGIHNKHFSKLS